MINRSSMNDNNLDIIKVGEIVFVWPKTTKNGHIAWISFKRANTHFPASSLFELLSKLCDFQISILLPLKISYIRGRTTLTSRRITCQVYNYLKILWINLWTTTVSFKTCLEMEKNSFKISSRQFQLCSTFFETTARSI